MASIANLSNFSVPIEGEINVCEINSHIHSQNFQCTNISLITNKIDNYPKIHITRDIINSSSENDNRNFFLPVEVGFLKKLSQVFYEQGVEEALYMLSNHQNFIISKSGTTLLALLNVYKHLQQVLNPALNHSGPSLIAEVSPNRDWNNQTIRALSWHPHSTRIAIATIDDIVRIYCESSPNYAPILRYKHQKNISCLAWRPCSMSELAVGYENGIIVWQVDPNSLVTRPSLSNATILYDVHHKPIVSLAWGIRGEILASAAACDSTIRIWDVELNEVSLLKGSGTGNAIIKMSPTGNVLFSATTGIVFRLWNCFNWESERWTVFYGRIQAACWVNGGNDLIFATNCETVLYSLSSQNNAFFKNDKNITPDQAVQVLDVNKIEVNGIVIGGTVRNMESDPNGKYLAILFADSNFILIFHIVKTNIIQVIPSSVVVGLPGEIPCIIAFQQNFKSGACLTIAWSSGRIQYYPLIYDEKPHSGYYSP